MPNRFLRIPDLIQLTGLSRSAIYARIQAGDFPRPLKLGSRVSVWDEADITAWQESVRESNRYGEAA